MFGISECTIYVQRYDSYGSRDNRSAHSRCLILGADFLECFGIQPMIDIGNEPERVETLNISKAVQKRKLDETLDLLNFEVPAEPVPESIETENE